MSHARTRRRQAAKEAARILGLCQLFETMMDLPKRFPRWCYDLKQLSCELGSPKYQPQIEGAHNALANARWSRDLYAFLMAYKREQNER